MNIILAQPPRLGGLCHDHNPRDRGKVDKIMKSVGQRFEEKIERITETGCWIWVGALSSNGYGSFQYEGTRIGAHVASFKMFNGELLPGNEVCHTCDIRCCVNPSHLFQGDRSVNMVDCIKKSRHRPGFAKISFEDAEAIRASPLRNCEICRIFGLSRNIVSRIRKGIHYKRPFKFNPPQGE